MAPTLEFVSVGCNRVAHCADWGSHGIVAFGAHKFVALYDVAASRVTATLRGHGGRVNAVAWLSSDALVSGAADGSVIVWRCKDGRYEEAHKLVAHTAQVLSLAVLTSGPEWLVATTSADKTVALWRQVGDEWQLCSHTSLCGESVECCALGLLPGAQVPLLALGGVGGGGRCRGSEILLYVLLPGVKESSALVAVQVCALKGHEDFVRCLSFARADCGSLLLASSSQDKYIRLWKVDFRSDVGSVEAVSGVAGAAEEGQDVDALAMLAALAPDDSLASQQRALAFDCGEQKYAVALDSVLCGHEDWVYSVAWQPPVVRNGKETQPMCLLSASMDKTMMIWRPVEDEGGVWVNETRVGELGGNTLGFYGGLFSPDAESILAHGYNGAFHLWQKKAVGDDSSLLWHPQPTVSGHFGSVTGCGWGGAGTYLLSVSHDQTARAFSQWRRGGMEAVTWHEVARPQIHGYDIECMAVVHNDDHMFVSGAEEKIFRVFEAPSSFLHTLRNVAKVEVGQSAARAALADGEQALGANVPTLGLSNKPVFTHRQPEVEDTAEKSFSEQMMAEAKPADPVFLSRPPYEEELLQSTLWPEMQKMYGHGNYTYCIACSFDGKWLATAVRAKSDPVQAAIRVWSTATWKEVSVLAAHKLTVTNLAFSKDNRFLLAVGRDRQVSVFEQGEQEGSVVYGLVQRIPKAHGRIVWSCDWTHDSELFVTGSRDKSVKIWLRDGTEFVVAEDFSPRKSAVTAVAFAPTRQEKDGVVSYLLAVGYEDGIIQLWDVARSAGTCKTVSARATEVAAGDCHCEAVKQLAWRPQDAGDLELASCSSDHSVRVFRIEAA